MNDIDDFHDDYIVRYDYEWDEFRWTNKKGELIYFIDMSTTYLNNLQKFCDERDLDVSGIYFELRRRGAIKK